MTARIARLRRVERARARLRDAAAALVAAAEARRHDSIAAEAAARAAFSAIVEGAIERLDERGSSALLALDDERRAVQALIARSVEDVAAATSDHAQRRAALQERERDLRRLEHARTRASAVQRRAEARVEQLLIDDLAAARHRGGR